MIYSFFKYELSAVPPALFQDNFMRHGTKSDLATAVLEGQTSQPPAEVATSLPVVDGGWLINYVRWQKGSTYRSVLHQHATFLLSKFGMCRVIFDGYASSTKDHEHLRRLTCAKKRANSISLKLDNKAYHDQAAFLANTDNKVAFIRELALYLGTAGHAITCCNADGDTTVVKTALNLARNDQSVRVVANDTDILVMLIHHWDNTMADIALHKQGAKKTETCIYSIRHLCASIHHSIKSNILFAHAWTGCDTTSHCYGFGKTQLLKYLKTRPEILPMVETISNVNSTVDAVSDCGVKLFLNAYGGSDCTDLAHLRHIKFKTMMADKNQIDVFRLPPSERSVHFHALRVHLQIVVWSTLDERCLDPLKWGWKSGSQGLEPVRTDLPPAPDCVLQFIRCNCKSLKNQCGTNICSCRKNGMACVDMCGGCHGEGCKNAEKVDLNDA